MTTRNFDALFRPQAIALIGASNQVQSVGAVLARNLFEGGFQGPIMTVNPHATTIRSTLNYKSVSALPVTPDLAVIATPPATVPDLITELGARGCRAAVVITAGFGEGEEAVGAELRARMLAASRPFLMRIVGPNCLGLMVPALGINASFAQLTPTSGDIAFITQSGAIATALLDWAAAKRIGFSSIVSLGDMSDVDFGDLLDHFALDSATRSILLYVESITSARKFMSAARIAARAKPVIVIKSGRSEAGARAALSHTGALAGSDAVYDAAFRRAGMIRVRELKELFGAAATLASAARADGERLLILTNGGGAGVLAVDALDLVGGTLAPLLEPAMTELDKVLPKSWSHANPVDILGDADGERYAKAIDILIQKNNQDAILVMNCPTGVVDNREAANAVLRAMSKKPTLPVLTCWLGETTAAQARKQFFDEGVPSYETPDDAVRAFMTLVEHQRRQKLLLETPAAGILNTPAERRAARGIIEAVLKDGRTVLTAPEAKALLSAVGIPVIQTMIAGNPEEAASHARTLGGAVALKILSPDITHKTDVGGVRLNLLGADAVRMAAIEMQDHIRQTVPAARLRGFTVEPMATRTQATELIAGIASDQTFGPIVLFGEGGIAVEVIGDRVIGLPPLNLVLAYDMIARTRVAKLLKGYRDVPAADAGAIASTLVKLSNLAADLPELIELDINPLLADASGVLALDARVVLRPVSGDSEQRLTIRPYPAELAKIIELPHGRRFSIRPICPEDELLLTEMVRRSDPEDTRLRFFGAMKGLSHQLAARLSQIDYDREMALIAVEAPKSDTETKLPLAGVVRIISDPNNEVAEFAVMVRTDLKGQGLGYRLMQEILAYAKAKGLGRVTGQVLATNTVMLKMVGELGGKIRGAQADPHISNVDFDLATLKLPLI
jgi:acetyltransferase